MHLEAQQRTRQHSRLTSTPPRQAETSWPTGLWLRLLALSASTVQRGHVQIQEAFCFLDEDGIDGCFAILNFGFSVSKLVFDDAGNLDGVFAAQALDSVGNVLDSFLDNDTDDSLPGSPEGTVTLTGSNITALRFPDTPRGLSFAAIDDLELTPVPLPAGLSLLIAGLAGFGFMGCF